MPAPSTRKRRAGKLAGEIAAIKNWRTSGAAGELRRKAGPATGRGMVQDPPLMVALNGPLGCGKSTLGEALGESIERSVTLDGDQLAALNPPPADEVVSLHETIALLVAHHLPRGYDRFIVNHYWSSRAEIADLEARLQAVAPILRFRCYRLTLTADENLRRIAVRQSVRAIDEAEFEARTFAEEHALLSAAAGAELGEPFDATDSPDMLVARMLASLGLPAAPAAPQA